MPKHARKTYKYPIRYRGSLIWPILFLFIFPPVVLLFLLANLAIVQEDEIFYLDYRGSFGWLIFWTIIFFPIAFILVLFNGCDVVAERDLTSNH